VLLGNYFGYPAQPITPLAGLRAKVGDQVDVLYAKGCDLIGPTVERTGRDMREGVAAAVEIARRADVVIMVLGLSQLFEGEEGQTEAVPVGQRGQGDRTDLDLPDVQDELLKAVQATGTPVVLVLMNGSALSITWADEYIPAILEAWYPGQAGGTAIADVLFGDYNPAGRLPVTFYRSVDQLPPFEDYDMAQGRTYRYFGGDPLYAFGHGLSYTRFAYRDLRVTPAQVQAGQPVQAHVSVTNVGARAGDEVVQIYLRDLEASAPHPIRQLVGFKRIHLTPNATQELVFEIKPEQMAVFDDHGQPVIEAGRFEISAGGRQPSPAPMMAHDTPDLVMGSFDVAGTLAVPRG
jgi:beta-glucosidase